MTAGSPAQAGSGEDPGVRTLTARRIAELVSGVLQGDGDAIVRRVAPIDRAGSGDITFLGTSRYAGSLTSCEGAVVLVAPDLAEVPGPVAARVVVSRPQEALLRILPSLHRSVERRPGVDATARLGTGVRLGSGVEIGPYAVIGANAVLGDRVVVGPHCVVGAGVSMGADCTLHSHVTLYSGTELGDRVTVHSGSRLGSDGYGYVFANGAHQKIPHVGRCLIRDDVEIGANAAIDRGSIDDTVIGAGTKVDNLVHIGHNVRIGALCLIMAQVGIAGSTRIGDGCVLAGQVGVSGHLTIGDRVRLAGQSGVIGNIPAGETWSGYPARPHTLALRSQAALLKVTAMFRKIERLVGGDE